MKSILLPAISLVLGMGAVSQAHAGDGPSAVLYEETLAHEEEARIVSAPIAGIQNNLWFDYRTDVGEAQKELASDLRHSSDTEDLRDAWDEYAHELKHERIAYVRKMAKRGYRQGEVIVG